jgi:hypothetical protein
MEGGVPGLVSLTLSYLSHKLEYTAQMYLHKRKHMLYKYRISRRIQKISTNVCRFLNKIVTETVTNSKSKKIHLTLRFVVRLLPSNAHISTPFFSKICFGNPPSKFLDVCLNSEYM